MLAVTGIGMVSPVGLDVISSCAAARSGIRRMIPLDDYLVFDALAETEVPLTVHRVPLLSTGLYGLGRLLQMALSALDDMRAGSGHVGRLGLVVATGSGVHRRMWLDRLHRLPEADREGFDLPEIEEGLADDQRQLSEAFVPAIVRHAVIDAEVTATRAITSDQTGFVSALEQANTWLTDGTCETCWVGGCDSFLDPSVLEALEGLHLLRSPDHAAGSIPGELACFVALENPRRSISHGRRVMAVIDGFAQEGVASPSPAAGEGEPQGQLLARAMARAEAGRPSGLVVVNLNGDPLRAAEWGHVQAHRLSQGIAAGQSEWPPPLYFGEIGAATGAAAVALLAQGWARRYAPASRASVALMEDGRARGAFTVASPGVER